MSPVSAQLTDTAPHTPPNYNGFVPPARGQSWTDPVFGTQIKRLSSAVSTPNTADGGTLTWVMNEYSTMSAFNSDRSRFILQHDSYYGLYDAAGNHQRDLPFAVHASSEPRWSRTSPNVLYFINGNQLKKHDVGSGATTVVRTFSEYGSISGHGESDICFDGDHLVLAGDSRYVFVVTLSTGAKGPVLDTAGHTFDGLYITPDGNVLVSYHQGGSARWSGIELYDSSMVFQRQVTRVGGHMDVTRDTDGQEVLVWTSSADPSPICDNGVVKVRLSNGNQTCLKELDWSLGVHVSCPDGNGWCFVSTYAPGEPDPGIGWPAYTNELLQVKLDGSQVKRLAHHRSRRHNGYNYMARMSASRDGARVLFASNFGLQATQGLPVEYSDAYLIEVTGGGGGGTPPPPAPPPPPPGGGGGGGGGGGNTPPPATSRIEQNAPAAVYTGTWHPNSSGVHSGGSAAMAMDAGSKVRLASSGTGVRWIGYRDEWSGIGRVLVDGVQRAMVDTYASPERAQQVLWSIENLPNGLHTLEIVATGNQGSQSGGAWIWVDAIEVIGGSGGASEGDATPPSGGGSTPPTGGGGGGGGSTPAGSVTRLQQGHPNVSYTGAWHNNTSAVHAGGSAKLAMAAGARVEVTFNGTGVSWIGYRDEWAGQAQVFVDGKIRRRISTYSDPARARQRLYKIEGLRRGRHTLEIRVVGQPGAGSTGAWVWVDAFDVVN